MISTFKVSSAFFAPSDCGKTICFADDSTMAIVRYLSPTVVMVFADPMPKKTNQPFTVVDAIWHRNGEDYDSTIQSGMEAFGSQDMEKQMDGYVPILSSHSPNAKLTLALRAATNPRDAFDRLSDTRKAPQTNNLIPVILAGNYLGDRITISGVNSPCEISSRLFRLVNIDANSWARQ